MLNVLAGFLFVQGLEVMLHRHPLRKLPHVRPFQHSPQFRLSHQNHLERGVVDIDIHQQPQFFENAR